MAAALAVVAFLAAAALASGCGVGPGPSSPGQATLTVTRDYGSKPLSEATESDPTQSETVIRFLDRETQLETRYGGGFVQSIDGLSGTYSGGRSFDWFFYVNGIESPVGAADVNLRGGDRVWWDYRDWTDSMRVPAVVGSWPEPFLQRSVDEGKRLPVRIECMTEEASCETVRDRLADEGVDSVSIKPGDAGGDELRIVVGDWQKISSTPEGKLISRGPQESGVFASFDDDGSKLVPLDPAGDGGDPLADAGLVAAVRDDEDPPVWLITGTDDAAVGEAAEALDPGDLHNRYALAVDGSQTVALPVDPQGPAG